MAECRWTRSMDLSPRLSTRRADFERIEVNAGRAALQNGLAIAGSTKVTPSTARPSSATPRTPPHRRDVEADVLGRTMHLRVRRIERALSERDLDPTKRLLRRENSLETYAPQSTGMFMIVLSMCGCCCYWRTILLRCSIFVRRSCKSSTLRLKLRRHQG